MTKTMSNKRFSLGQTVITSNAIRLLVPADVWDAVNRHARGDWGDVCDEDWTANNEALDNKARLLSRYVDSRGNRFWIITEWDRSHTTILLPADY